MIKALSAIVTRDVNAANTIWVMATVTSANYRVTIQVYAANIFELVRLQANSADIKHCWEHARRFHNIRAQQWDSHALANQLRRQVEWEEQRRVIVAENVRLDRLEKMMTAEGNGNELLRDKAGT